MTHDYVVFESSRSNLENAWRRTRPNRTLGIVWVGFGAGLGLASLLILKESSEYPSVDVQSDARKIAGIAGAGLADRDCLGSVRAACARVAHAAALSDETLLAESIVEPSRFRHHVGGDHIPPLAPMVRWLNVRRRRPIEHKLVHDASLLDVSVIDSDVQSAVGEEKRKRT